MTAATQAETEAAPALKLKEVAVIVDIDGTVADNSWRGPFEFDKVDGDYPRLEVIAVVKALRAAGYRILFTSGRMEQSRQATLEWLNKFIGPAILSYNLFLRADGDYRPDTVVKSELYDTHIKDNYIILVVIDDRQSVVKMWREEKGLTVLQCAEGEF